MARRGRPAQRAGRARLTRRVLARLRHLYARAVRAGDTRAALAVLKAEALLLGLYPARRRWREAPPGPHSGPPEGPFRG